MRKKIEQNSVLFIHAQKVCYAAIEKNPANANDKKEGNQVSKRNKKEVPKHGVANNIKGKKVASKSKVGRGKPKRDDDSEGTPEGNNRMMRRTTRIMHIIKKRLRTTLRQRTKTNMREGRWRRLWTEQLWIRALTRRRRRRRTTTTTL